MTDCYDYIDEASGRHSKIIADDVYDIMMANKVRPPLPPRHATYACISTARVHPPGS